MRSKSQLYLSLLIVLSLLTACEKDIKINLPGTETEYVVEAYITNYHPIMNYVIITNTFSLGDSAFRFNGILGAKVSMTEGALQGSDTVWNGSSTVNLIGIDSIPGLYMDINAFVNPKQCLMAKQGYIYKLDIFHNNKHILGYTSIPEAVNADSISFLPSGRDSSLDVTAYVTDPISRGNNYRASLMTGASSSFSLLGDSIPFLWGSFEDRNDFVTNDDIVNGIQRNFVYRSRVYKGDTLNYFLSAMNRNEYNFWLSVSNAKNNGGPFATPIKLNSTLNGAIGCFTGYNVSHTRTIVK